MILIVDMNFKPDSLGFLEFVLPIVSIVEKRDDFSVRHHLEMMKDDISQCDKIILSGNALKNNSFHNKIFKFKWIKNCEKPIFGICAGMQTLGLVFGHYLKECVEIGMIDVTTILDNPLFSSKFKAYALHKYSVEISENFEVLAKSDKCVQAMKHKKKDIYGVLFHPEVRNTDIIKNFLLL